MFKRSGVWWICIRVKGRKIQKSLETSDKKLATAIEAKIRTEIVEGKYFDKPKVENITVRDLIDKYLADHSKPNKAPKTYQDDIYFSKRILEKFGNMDLSAVSPKHISAFIKKRRNDGVGDVMINHELRLLRHAYNLAIRDWELIDQSPFSKVKIPTGNVKRVRYLSEQEEERLIKALPDWLAPIVIVARESGLRRSNIVNLLWSQVNLFSKIIVISGTEMKNDDALGIPMTENVYGILKNLYKERCLDSDYVFGKNGEPFKGGWISKSFQQVCEKARVDNFRFHDLRHDFCSKLVQRGVDLYRVAALAGHRDIKTTQRYAHLSQERLRSAVEVFNSDYNLTTVGKKRVDVNS